MDEIVARTGLPIALEGIYRWVAFLPSRLDQRIPTKTLDEAEEAVVHPLNRGS